MKNNLLKQESKSIIYSSLITLLLMSCSLTALTQNKKNVQPDATGKIISYEILDNGDSINRLDDRQLKQGKWLIVNKGGFGEEDFMELGNYLDDIKSGQWRKFSMDGMLISDEFFRRGNRDGEARYFDEGYLYCVGNYLALRSQYLYDTILVEDPVSEVMKPVVIRSDVGSVRHGFWTYYDPPSTQVKKVIEYQADEVVYEKEYITRVDSVYIKAKMKSWPHVSDQPQKTFWMQEKGRKPATFTDFPENTEYVKPNVRKK